MTDPSAPGAEMIVACPDVTATRAVAAALVPHLEAGDAVLLVGDLGAGKTAFTQGLAAAAGVTEAVTSPTFNLLRSYPTALGLELAHIDVYRLDTTDQIADLGLAELLDGDAFAIIEWGERAATVVGPDHLEIRFVQPGTDDRRELRLHAGGPTWARRWPAIAVSLGLASGPSVAGAERRS